MIKKRLSEERKTEDLKWEEITKEVNEVVGLELEETDKVESARSYPRVALSGQGLHHSYDRMVQGYCEAIMSSCKQCLRKLDKSPPAVEADIL